MPGRALFFVISLGLLGARGPPPPREEAGGLTFRREAPQGAATVRVLPAHPWSGRHVTVLVDFGGDPLFAKGTELSLAVSAPAGTKALAHVVLQPLPKKGLYGAHFTAEQAGAYQLAFHARTEPSLEGRSLFDVPLTVEATQPASSPFPSPAPTERPAPAPEEDVVAEARPPPQTKQGVPRMPLDLTMEALGNHWDDLGLLLKAPNARKTDALGQLAALQQLSANIAGQLPKQSGASRREFDTYARQLETRMANLQTLLPDRPAARAEMQDMENNVCLRCHTKFRFNIAEDVKDWPRFEPREPKTPETKR